MKRTSKGFSEEISNLGGIWDEGKREKTTKEFFANEVAIKLDMLGAFVKNGVFGDMHGESIVTM
ncbi:MAG: hypothetical protein Q8838_02585 [Candidatus Phytoplasma australasiaticum]|nr:hypothetical protein [Candidatus Phytoplasma australasiaticum]